MSVDTEVRRTRCRHAARFLHDSLRDEWLRGGPESYSGGGTEPWVGHLLAALVLASGSRVVLEVGTYMGHTSATLCLALAAMGGGVFAGAEPDAARRAHTVERLDQLYLPNVTYHVYGRTGEEMLRGQEPATIDLVFLDGDHTREVVAREAALARVALAPGGLLCGHDVHGSFDLASLWTGDVEGVVGGIALALPQLHAAGGLGIWQKPI